jgi:hypothetical protein
MTWRGNMTIARRVMEARASPVRIVKVVRIVRVVRTVRVVRIVARRVRTRGGLPPYDPSL